MNSSISCAILAGLCALSLSACIDSKDPIADQSDYTVIIARKFEMKQGPELVLNTDYENSPIPVPDGVGNKSRPMIRLAH